MTVSSDEFLRRFLIHVLPKGLVRIRHFGLFAAGEVLRSNVAALCLVRRPVSIRTSSPACAVRPAPASCWSSNG
jgi:hypothetical protein